MLVFSIIGGTHPTLGIISGPAADRFGTRLATLLGMIGLGVGLIYARFGVGASLGVGCIFPPTNARLQRWSTRNRGLSSGLAITGVGVNILAAPPLVGVLIDSLDWHQTI